MKVNARLIAAIVTSLIDEVIILAIIIGVLPRFGIRIPLWGMILLVIAFAIYAVGSFIIGSRILRKKPLLGQTDMVGTEGRVTSPLNPRGFVRIEGELWEARAEKDTISVGVDVIVVAQKGLKLVVSPKSNLTVPFENV